MSVARRATRLRSATCLAALLPAVPLVLLAACGGGSSEAAPPGTPSEPTSPTAFTVTSSAVANGGLSVDATCDGAARAPTLAWSGAPTSTAQFAVLMTTATPDGTIKYNWVVYGIPGTARGLDPAALTGTQGQADDGAGTAYAPPCSQGPGLKQYTFTVYALSAPPAVLDRPPAQVSGAVLVAALGSITSARATMTAGVTRTTAQIHCGYVRAAFEPWRTVNDLAVTCDSTYAYVSTTGIQSRHSMMDGITATNQQVPLPQNFTGTNAWRLPLVPRVAASKVSAVDGPIGIAVNGVPIFNPCKQGGCSGPGGGDTKLLGELDRCNGHAGRADDYHYHAAPVCLMSEQGAAYWDTHPVGYALDGFAIFGYRAADGTIAARDAGCGGSTATHPNAPTGYAYHVTDQSPYVLSCFHGEPSPDLAIQSTKYRPIRPPGTPMAATAMRLDASASSLAVGGTSTMSWRNGAQSYEVRYQRTTTTCWRFTFVTNGTTTATQDYCRDR